MPAEGLLKSCKQKLECFDQSAFVSSSSLLSLFSVRSLALYYASRLVFFVVRLFSSCGLVSYSDLTGALLLHLRAFLFFHISHTLGPNR